MRLSADQKERVAQLAPIAERMAKRYVRASSGRNLSDLTGPAHEALVDAVLRYDAVRGPLEPWVILRVRGALLDALRGQARVRRRELLVLGAAFAAGEGIGSEEDAVGSASLAAFFEAPSPREQALAALRTRVADVVLRVAAAQGSDEPSAEDALADRQLGEKRAEALRRELERLDDEDRRVAQAIYFEGRSSEDVAASLGCSERHLRRIHHRLRERLALRLKRELVG
jgi:RNA polymerase sigma factor (sigma-70 family)